MTLPTWCVIISSIQKHKEIDMSCDIHTSILVKIPNQDKYAPLYGTTMFNGHPDMIMPPYFQAYNVFGMLTGNTVRGGSLANCVSSVDLHDKLANDDRFAIPLKGKFPFHLISWPDMSYLGPNISTADFSENDCDYATKRIQELQDENAHILYASVPVLQIEYYGDEWYHSHNFFTLNQLKKLIKRIEKMIKNNRSQMTPSSLDQVKYVLRVLKMYKNYTSSVINSVMRFEMPDDHDVIILVCFDS